MTRIGLSFDDGREDNIKYVVPLLREFDLPGTFNITTGYVDSTLKKENVFCDNKALTIKDVLMIDKDSLFEISLHGNQHLNTKEDILESKIKLSQWGIDTHRIGLASPNHVMGSYSIDVIQNFINEFDLAYVRVGGPFSKAWYSRILRELTRIFPSNKLFINMYKCCIMKKNQPMHLLYSLPVNNRMRISQLKKMIDYTVKCDGNLILLFHSILKSDDDYYHNYENLDYDFFKELCKFLKEKKDAGVLEVCKTREIENNND